MADLPADGLLLEERMAAETGVFLIAVPRRDVLGAMPEKAAEVSHLLPEGGGGGVGIMRRLEQQRMSALHAHVFVAAVAISELLVLMRAEEAGECVPDSRGRQILAEVCRPAPAAPMTGGMLEHVIVDVMSPQRARELRQ
jgi:hypothetical protein